MQTFHYNKRKFNYYYKKFDMSQAKNSSYYTVFSVYFNTLVSLMRSHIT